jgi:hypothetical protein
VVTVEVVMVRVEVGEARQKCTACGTT